MSGSVDNRGRSRGGEDGAAPASIPMSEVGPTVDDMSAALWNDPAPAPRPAGWGAATHVAAGLWRIADPRGIVVGHVRAIAADGDWRYAAERFHAASGRFRRLGEFWSSNDALECLRYAR
ncbi:hypothetical protein SAMN05216418_1237 [Microbacterium enclense]|uniref:Uncharacterized protein n=2 Tax=Microbacterium enclense TaxID=993073 RepID=A0A1G6HIU7_9MICO|nr:hypothetical protein SAMN05216418_1237 [Microbacterium enclense]